LANRKYYLTTKHTKDTKVSDIDILKLLNFVLFVTFVVKVIFSSLVVAVLRCASVVKTLSQSARKSLIL